MTGQEIRFGEGETIFRQGDSGDRMFVVVEGRVGLYLEGGGMEYRITALGPGEFFGELSLLAGTARSATARAVEPSLLLQIGRGAFEIMMQDDIGLVFRMVSALGRRVLDSNATRLDLVDRLGRIRVVTLGLGRLARESAFPRTIALADLAADAGVSEHDLAPILRGLAENGAGRIDDGVWRFAAAAEVERLVAAVDQDSKQISGYSRP